MKTCSRALLTSDWGDGSGTIVGLISDNDETHYREEIQHLTQWFSNNNLVLNTSKTKEVIVDYRRSRRTEHAPLLIHGEAVKRVNNIKFLGIHITSDLNLVHEHSSPDLNPIEHIWDIMSRSIHQRHVAPQTVQELADALVQIALLDGINWASSTTVRNLGVLFDQDMVSSTPILSIFQGLPFTTCATSQKCRHLLSQSDAEKLVHAFLSSRLELLTRVLCSQNAGLLVVPKISRSSLGAEPSAIRPLFSGTSSQSGSERQTQCQCLRIDLKPSFLIKLIVRVGTGPPLVMLL
ncbi:hypothetical protein L3Q82_024358 [Scortum barcoo]|uniref:Uncharacterized protein n=1 Tax=Scortum barcoo TaxID=214431 RepID=A0ACB8WUT8_9TELE|nr:hypothetical protein L3Q82_024358 [Scortum barcoo]